MRHTRHTTSKSALLLWRVAFNFSPYCFPFLELSSSNLHYSRNFDTTPFKMSTKDLPTQHFINNEVSKHQHLPYPHIARLTSSSSGYPAPARSCSLITLLCPKNSTPIPSTLHSASANDVDTAVSNSNSALASGPWTRFTGETRGRCLARLADLIEEHVEEIAYVESIASGRALSMTARDVLMRAKGFICA